MAVVHEAQIHPTKLELLSAWLPGRSWYQEQAGAELTRVAACRFDDPAGEVGVETILVRAGDGPIHHVPLTYRGAPLEGGDDWLVGTMEHSVLGPRWVYDACGDPVYVAALASAMFAGTGQAEEFKQAADGRQTPRQPDMFVAGSGANGAGVPTVAAVRRVVDEDPTLIETDSVALAVVRIVGDDTPSAEVALTGTWDGQSMPALLAYARPA
ncbi:hypothetical protein GCM10023322_53310 [Rugosimonospora acidiphila]|uniref:Maltokinase N-terminal cap domain-containing protein n=1 Tax=Rugosimonospora acidiphila TaxID=556531 RepID=A0ABP9SBP5_9ACTN